MKVHKIEVQKIKFEIGEENRHTNAAALAEALVDTLDGAIIEIVGQHPEAVCLDCLSRDIASRCIARAMHILECDYDEVMERLETTSMAHFLMMQKRSVKNEAVRDKLIVGLRAMLVALGGEDLASEVDRMIEKVQNEPDFSPSDALREMTKLVEQSIKKSVDEGKPDGDPVH